MSPPLGAGSDLLLAVESKCGEQKGRGQMRTHVPHARGSRTFTDVFTDAAAILRQDAGEYAFITLVGAFIAASVALVLRVDGSATALALIAPVIAGMSLLTLGAITAAVRRADDNLQPEATRAFLAALYRSPAMMLPLLPAILLLALSTYAGVRLGEETAPLIGLIAAVALSAFAALWAFRRSLYVAALFARGASLREAGPRATAAMGTLAAPVAVTWLLSLTPALIIATPALLLGFGPLGAALTALVSVGCMPLAATMLWLLYGHSSAATAAILEKAPRNDDGGRITARAGRHIR